MFEIIKTQKIFNFTCYKVKTSHSIEWFYFEGKESHTIRYLKRLNYYRKSLCRFIPPVVCLSHEDWEDVRKFLKSLN